MRTTIAIAAMTLSFGVALCNAQTQAEPAAPAASFPADYLGRWDLFPENCTSAESAFGITVTDTQVITHEETSTVQSINVLEGGSLHVYLIPEKADGEKTIQTVIWRSAEEGGDWLNMEDDSRPRAVRYARCPAGSRSIQRSATP